MLCSRWHFRAGYRPFRTYPKRVCSGYFQSLALRKHARVGLLSSAQRKHLAVLGLVNLRLAGR